LKAGRARATSALVSDRLPLPTLPSPCTGVCTLEPETGLCAGCLRTIDEIGLWPDASEAERLAILRTLCDRRRARGRTSAADSRPRRRVPAG
jgi:predicted Fe-S protein YdhL (DUF1289 family)